MNTQRPYFEAEAAPPPRGPGGFQGTVPQPPADDEVDLGRLLRTLWAGKLTIAILTLLGLAMGGVFYATTPPQWQADSLLQLEERSGRLALPDAMRQLVDNNPRIATEVELLRSRMILGQAIADINLDWRADPVLAPVLGQGLRRYPIPLPDIDELRPYARPGERIEIEFLQVPAGWRDVPMPLTVTAQGFTIQTPDGAVLNGRLGETLANEANTFAIRLSELRAPPGRAYVVRQLSPERAIGQLRAGLIVTERGRGSGVLELRYRAGSPTEATQALNAITQAYVRQNITRSAAEAQSSLDFIEQRLPDAERAVTEAAQALNTFRREQAVLDLSFDTQNLLSQIARTEAELRELDEREGDISQRLTPNHPLYRQILSERAVLEERLERRLAELRMQASELPETQREMVNLTRELDMAQTIYNQLVARAQEIRVVRASTVGNVRIVDSAMVSGQVAPNRTQTLSLALAFGMISGMALVLLRSWMRRGVQSVMELERQGMPVFATINYTPYAQRGRPRRGGKMPIVALSHPDELAIEAFRSLRTSLHFGLVDASSRSIVITSSAPDAGKSFVASNLAVVAAQAGQRVLLVDGDLRRGQLRRHFVTDRNAPGLAEYLAGAVELDEVLVGTDVEGLWFLPAGRYPPNPSELLMRRELAKLVNAAGATFDLTIFDTAPVLAVTDAAIIGRTAGTTLTVVRHGETTLEELQATRKVLEQAGVRFAGCVLNGYDPRKADYGQNAGHGYRYSYKSRGD